jgi:multidrug efflux pump subunit AcrA (membrane-fusion protein)
MAMIRLLVIAHALLGTDGITDQQELIRQLQAANETLQERVTQLERENAELRERISDQLAPWVNPNSDFFMTIEEIRPYEPNSEDNSRLKALRSEAKQLDSEAGRLRSPPKGGYVSRGARSRASRLEAEARKLRRQADLLEQSWADAYWILGWDSRRDVMIFAPDVDRSFIMSLRLNQTLTWKGEVVDTALGHPRDRDFITVEAQKIALAPATRFIEPRWEDRTPVWRPTDEEATYPRLPIEGE